MEQNEIDINDSSFKLYEILENRIKGKQEKIDKIDKMKLKGALSSLSKENSQIAYYLILHHYFITKNIDPHKLENVKLVFYGQKELISGNGITFSNMSDPQLLIILNEFVEYITFI